MLEGKEVEGKIGNPAAPIGAYSVDVEGDAGNIGKVIGEVSLSPSISKDLVPAMPGALVVEAEGDLKLRLKADPVILALAEIKKLHAPFADVVADALAKLRAGQALPAAAQAAVDAAAAPSA